MLSASGEMSAYSRECTKNVPVRIVYQRQIFGPPWGNVQMLGNDWDKFSC